MKTENHKFFSPALGQDFEFRSYGSGGKPVMVFPTSCGRFYDYEDRSMIKTLGGLIENGDVRIFTVDGRDAESWYKPVKDEWIGIRHRQYENCVINEAIPYLMSACGVTEKFTATGCSFGAFHAANFFLKFPRYFDSAVCLSGAYDMRTELGGYFDDGIYFNEPLSYLPGLKDENILKQLREGYIVIAHGRGAWELFNGQSGRFSEILRSKSITCWYDAWGEDFHHDWPTWKAQIIKYMTHFREGVLFKGGTLKLTGPERRVNRLFSPSKKGIGRGFP